MLFALLNHLTRPTSATTVYGRLRHRLGLAAYAPPVVSEKFPTTPVDHPDLSAPIPHTSVLHLTVCTMAQETPIAVVEHRTPRPIIRPGIPLWRGDQSVVPDSATLNASTEAMSASFAASQVWAAVAATFAAQTQTTNAARESTASLLRSVRWKRDFMDAHRRYFSTAGTGEYSVHQFHVGLWVIPAVRRLACHAAGLTRDLEVWIPWLSWTIGPDAPSPAEGYCYLRLVPDAAAADARAALGPWPTASELAEWLGFENHPDPGWFRATVSHAEARAHVHGPDEIGGTAHRLPGFGSTSPALIGADLRLGGDPATPPASVPAPESALAAGNTFAAQFATSGYCYLHLVPASHHLAAMRALGALPLALDVALWIQEQGLPDPGAFPLESSACGLFGHVLSPTSDGGLPHHLPGFPRPDSAVTPPGMRVGAPLPAEAPQPAALAQPTAGDVVSARCVLTADTHVKFELASARLVHRLAREWQSVTLESVHACITGDADGTTLRLGCSTPAQRSQAPLGTVSAVTVYSARAFVIVDAHSSAVGKTATTLVIPPGFDRQLSAHMPPAGGFRPDITICFEASGDAAAIITFEFRVSGGALLVAENQAFYGDAAPDPVPAE